MVWKRLGAGIGEVVKNIILFDIDRTLIDAGKLKNHFQ